MSDSPWYVEAFRSDYRDVYAHRNVPAARVETEWVASELLAGVTGPVLDDCCGFGRHSLALRERGVDVFGIDLSQDLLQSSRDLERGVELLGGRLACADMRALPFQDASFGAVLNLFTSFGYLGAEDDRAALGEMARVLRPGGLLVMDLMNPSRIREGLQPSSREERDGIILESERALQDGGKRVTKTVRLTLASGEVRTWHEDVRMYEPEELDRLMATVGIQPLRRAGAFDGRPFDAATAERQIVVARRDPAAPKR
ncbi:MAG: SAM-dependent methyltransferase [Planctomycetota bacterium]|jgi:SAM-dependent methyltransferase